MCKIEKLSEKNVETMGKCSPIRKTLSRHFRPWLLTQFPRDTKYRYLAQYFHLEWVTWVQRIAFTHHVNLHAKYQVYHSSDGSWSICRSSVIDPLSALSDIYVAHRIYNIGHEDTTRQLRSRWCKSQQARDYLRSGHYRPRDLSAMNDLDHGK